MTTLSNLFNLIEKDKFITLFLFIVIYILFTVTASKKIALSFTVPFQNLKDNMDTLLNSQTTPKKPKQFNLSEFNFIQDFIFQRFLEREKYIKKINMLGNAAMQAVHDIKSPATAMLMYTKEGTGMNENERLALRQAAERVYDIANSLMDVNNTDTHKNPVLLALSLSSLISEKQKEFSSLNLTIQYDCKDSASFAFSNVEESQFKRVISNIINNSIEAILAKQNQTGKVDIVISATANKITIKVSDNGLGIPEEKLKLINNGEDIASTKSGNMGLGIKYAYQFVKNNNAELTYDSQESKGTQATLTLPRVSSPLWLADKISLMPNATIVVADDDNAIHFAWEQKLKKHINDSNTICLKHCYSCTECLNYFAGLSQEEKQQTILLTDYEFVNDHLNGLDLIGRLAPKYKFLVTSYYSDKEVVKKAILLNTKIIPKLLTTSIKVLSSSDSAPTKHSKVGEADLVLLDNEQSLVKSLKYMAAQKGYSLEAFDNPYDFWEALAAFSPTTIFCLDYDLGIEATGVDIARQLNSLGYKNLYLVSGYTFNEKELPDILSIIKNKSDIFNLIRKRSDVENE